MLPLARRVRGELSREIILWLARQRRRARHAPLPACAVAVGAGLRDCRLRSGIEREENSQHKENLAE